MSTPTSVPLAAQRPLTALTHDAATPAAVLARIGAFVSRYSLVLIIGWFGIFKFTHTEAVGVHGVAGGNMLFGWLYAMFSEQAVSNGVGSAEIAIALLIALRPWAPRLSAVGSLGAVGMFSTTLSFLLTAPGAFAHVEGLWVPGAAGSFLIKDLTMLGAAFWTAGEALYAANLRAACLVGK